MDRRLTEAQVQEAVDAYVGGARLGELAARYGMPRATMRGLLRRRCVRPAERVFIAGYCWRDGRPYVVAATATAGHEGGYCSPACRAAAKRAAKLAHKRERQVPCAGCGERRAEPDDLLCASCWGLLRRGCQGKTRYPRAWEARRVMAKMDARPGRAQPPDAGWVGSVYRCVMCGHWHIGRTVAASEGGRQKAREAATALPRHERLRIADEWAAQAASCRTAAGGDVS